MSVIFATVEAGGRVTIPVEVREAYGIQPGCRIGFRLGGGKVTLEIPARREEIRETELATMRVNNTLDGVSE